MSNPNAVLCDWTDPSTFSWLSSHRLHFVSFLDDGRHELVQRDTIPV